LTLYITNRIGATVLSHHTDDFSLVSAFFLFSLGCLNILLGLIFREKAKTKRSILSWREEAKAILPTEKFPVAPPSFVSSMFTGEKGQEDFGTWKSGGSASGNGFGRQGEKAAGLKGKDPLH
jgi:hypothetical protein